MKCQACNFDENQQPPRESWQKPLGFIELEGGFSIYRREPYRPIEQHEISVYACPVCGTLKIDPNSLLLI